MYINAQSASLRRWWQQKGCSSQLVRTNLLDVRIHCVHSPAYGCSLSLANTESISATVTSAIFRAKNASESDYKYVRIKSDYKLYIQEADYIFKGPIIYSRGRTIYSSTIYYIFKGGTEAEIQFPLKRSSRFQRLFPNPSWLV